MHKHASHHPRNHLLFSTLLALLAAIVLPVTTASAEDDNPVGQCTGAGEVWLLVVDDNEEVLANQCVGTPETGQAALEAAGVEIGTDASGFICSLGGVPDPCPETFTGQYWNYHHATPGEQWQYYEVGATDSAPEPGTIEGWCYNAEGTENCTPPLLKVVQDGQVVLGDGVTEDQLSEPATTGEDAGDTTDDAEDSSEGTNLVWLVWVVAGIAVVGGLVAVFLGSNKKSGKGTETIGGR